MTTTHDTPTTTPSARPPLVDKAQYGLAAFLVVALIKPERF